MRRLSLVTGALSTVGIVGVVSFLLWGPQIRQRLGDHEVFKLSYQFLLLAVVGGAVSLMYQTAGRERDRREADRVIQRDVYKHLVMAYNEAKKVRRLLRARALRSAQSSVGFVVAGREYDKQLQSLIDAQLALELVIHGIEGDERLFPAAPVIVKKLKPVEHYLSEIIAEYEGARRTFSRGSPTKGLADLPKLSDFVAPYVQSEGFPRFNTQFHDALLMLRRIIRS